MNYCGCKKNSKGIKGDARFEFQLGVQEIILYKRQLNVKNLRENLDAVHFIARKELVESLYTKLKQKNKENYEKYQNITKLIGHREIKKLNV